jgi:rod shape determining protein RodA
MIDRRLLKYFDWFSILIILLLSTIGILTIYSATRPLPGAEHALFYKKQFYWLCISLSAFLIAITIDYKWLYTYSYFILGFGILLLILVIVTGTVGLGAKRWLSLGFFSFQPSEFFKIFFVIAFSRYLSDVEPAVKEGFGFLEISKIMFYLLLLPMSLIIVQPDLGTALMLLFIFTAMMLVSGIKRKVIVISLIIGLIAFPFIKPIVWSQFLKGYQKNRIIAFLDTDIDPKGIGYQIKQSKISIGSGGFLGKGYMEGTQGHLRFLPERHTDFIFAVFGEEFGFIGSMVIFFLYLTLLLRGIETAFLAREAFGRFLALGVTAMLFFYFTVNIGMTLGMMPVVGVPMPFMSYGGTALLSNFMAVSILVNVRTRRFTIC